MILAIGSDHAGYEMKEHFIPILVEWGHVVQDMGTNSKESVDYPSIAEEVALAVRGGKVQMGILFCGTGQGMAMVANKVPGIRAAVCNDVFSARCAREHNNANILSIGSRVVGIGQAELILKIFLDTQFAGERHHRRINLLTEIERKYLKQEDK